MERPIIEVVADGIVQLSSIMAGETFWYGDILCMKLSDVGSTNSKDGRCVALEDGQVFCLTPETAVKPTIIKIIAPK